MKQLFSQAIQKIKRKDFLDDTVREKTAECSEITAEIATLRKKNGSRAGKELDLQIYQLNARKSAIDTLISKCKTEIKVLKAEIQDLLTDCYARTDAPEIRAKVDAACEHAFGGKLKLLSDEAVGGIWGDCEIIGAIVTHDKKQKHTVAQLVKAGVGNSAGGVVKRPQIFVYDYDKKKENGSLHPETDEFKVRAKRKKPNPVIQYLKGVYFNLGSIFTLSFAAIYAVFAVWSILGGFANGLTAYLRVRTPLVIGIFLAFFTLCTLKEKRGGVADMLPLAALLVGLISLGCAFGYADRLKAFILPIVLLVYAVVAFILRAIFGGKDVNFAGGGLVLAIASGVVAAFVFREATVAPVAFWATFAVVFGVIAAVGAVLSLVKRKCKLCEFYSCLAFFGCAFCLTCLMFMPNLITTVILLAFAGVFGLCPVISGMIEKDV